MAVSLHKGLHGRVFVEPSDSQTCRAIKVCWAGEDGVDQNRRPHNVLREVTVLKALSHPNIATLLGYEYIPSRRDHGLTLKLLAFPLRAILRDLPPRSRLGSITRSIAVQLCTGIAHLHGRGIAHRDLNPSNIMLDWDGTVVLIDFGTAWAPGYFLGGDGEGEGMVCQVGTGPYRAPELLFGPERYDSQAVDLWALGAVLAEFFLSSDNALLVERPLEDADEDFRLYDPLESRVTPTRRTTLFDDTFGDIGLAGSIFRIRGLPNEHTWPRFVNLPDANKFAFDTFEPQPLSDMLQGAEPTPSGSLAINLIDQLLALDPTKRIPVADAMTHPWLSESTVLPEGYEELLGVRATPLLSGGPLNGEALVDLLEPYLSSARRKLHWC